MRSAVERATYCCEVFLHLLDNRPRAMKWEQSDSITKKSGCAATTRPKEKPITPLSTPAPPLVQWLVEWLVGRVAAGTGATSDMGSRSDGLLEPPADTPW